MDNLERSLCDDGQILRGRREIAEYLRISTDTLDSILDRKELEVYRPAGKNSGGIMLATRRNLLDFIDRGSHEQSKRR